LRLIATQVFAEIGIVKRCVSSPELHMPNGTAKFVSALVAGLLVGAPLTTASHGAPADAAAAADECLAGPKGTAPQGGHWYYRIERGTKRHCWYLGDEKDKAARAATEKSSASADPASPPKKVAPQRDIADARAELPVPQTQAEPGTSITAQSAVAPVPNAAGTDTTQLANPSDTNIQSSPQSSVIASRWPDSPGVSPAASPAPAPATYQSAATVEPDAADAVEEPAPAAAPVTLAAADSSATRQIGSIQTLLLVILGALSLAGLIGSAIFRFGRMRRTERRDVSGDRRAIWDSVSPSPRAYPRSDAPMPAADIPRAPRAIPRETRAISRETRPVLRETRPVPRETRAVAHETHAADDPNRRITEMLARLSRTAAN
jgi:hypothetical protein